MWEARLRVQVDGAVIHRALASEASGPDLDHPGEALARVLRAWQANELSDYAHIWRATDGREVEHKGAVLLVRRPDRRVHLVGPASSASTYISCCGGSRWEAARTAGHPDTAHRR